tara:strand:+ start:10457 stop:11770 length:1314 start_codon:yes stop_codon:yes gene_type:complete
MLKWRKGNPGRETKIQNEAGLELYLRLEITNEIVVAQTGEKTVVSERGELRVTPNFIDLRCGPRRRIIDFPTARDINVDETNSEHVDESLFATVHFRHSEFLNCQYIRGVLKAGGVDDVNFSPSLLSHKFSLASTEPKADAITWKRKGCEAYAQRKKLFARDSEHTTVSKPNAARFAQFLRYQVGGHPLILDRLVQESLVPARVEFWLYETGVTIHQTICISECNEVVSGSYDVTGNKETTGIEDDDIFATMIALRKTPNVLDDVTDSVAELLANNRGLDALLTVLEYSLSGGEIDDSLRVAIESASAVDSNASKFSELLKKQPASEEEARLLLTEFAHFSALATCKGSVIGCFAAPVHRSLGDGAAAMESYKVALRANPRIAGAYKDLGDVLVEGYAHNLGYRCWDMARWLAPKMSMFDELSAFEVELRASYPEYF